MNEVKTKKMSLQKWINRIFGKNKAIPQVESKAQELYDTEKFINWIKIQNAQHQFAEIKDGTTVYFRDDLAAYYDLMIRGLGEPRKCIVVQFERAGLRKDFMEIAINIWVKEAGWELWYIAEDLQWMVKANEHGRTKYEFRDNIQSDGIGFEFKLCEI